MTRIDLKMVRYLRQIADHDPCTVLRGDLMRLMMLASLTATKTYRRVRIDPSPTVTVEPDILRCMCRLAVGTNGSVPILEERLIEDEAGRLTWEVRLAEFNQPMSNKPRSAGLARLGITPIVRLGNSGRGQSN
jgi:hypothetical protein